MKNISDNTLIGARIKEAREMANLSQADLAKLLGYESATAVSLIEAGERRVKAEDLNIVSNVTHCDINYLMGQKEQAFDVRVALRADKDLTDSDKEAVLHFINLAKKKRGK